MFLSLTSDKEYLDCEQAHGRWSREKLKSLQFLGRKWHLTSTWKNKLFVFKCMIARRDFNKITPGLLDLILGENTFTYISYRYLKEKSSFHNFAVKTAIWFYGYLIFWTFCFVSSDWLWIYILRGYIIVAREISFQAMYYNSIFFRALSTCFTSEIWW